MVSLKVLEPRVCSLWKSEMRCEVIDMDNGFFSVRFFSRQDYVKVLSVTLDCSWKLLDSGQMATQFPTSRSLFYLLLLDTIT